LDIEIIIEGQLDRIMGWWPGYSDMRGPEWYDIFLV